LAFLCISLWDIHRGIPNTKASPLSMPPPKRVAVATPNAFRRRSQPALTRASSRASTTSLTLQGLPGCTWQTVGSTWILCSPSWSIRPSGSVPDEFLDRPGTAQIFAGSRGQGTPRAVGRKCAMSAMGAGQFCPSCAAVPGYGRPAGPRQAGTPRRSERLVHRLRRGSPVLRAHRHRQRRGCLRL
jgi:hypothetical protein